MDTTSLHLLAEYWGCAQDLLTDAPRLEELLRRAAGAAEMSVVGAIFHRFSPDGVSGVLLLRESHMSIHTWPEAGYAAVDIYTCGAGSPRVAHEVLARGLGCARDDTLVVRRGDGRPPRVW